MPPHTAPAPAGGFLPHGFCYLWNRPLLLTHLTSDIAIGLSYVAISLALGYLVWRARREIPFSILFVSFGLFIVACGATHFMEVWTLWHPAYWLAGGVKVVAALASAATAAAMPFAVPRVLATVRDARASEARRVSLAAAEEADRAKSRFVATMSHELRTPLYAIVGYGELLSLELCGPVTVDQREKLGRMRLSAEHLITLINQVLDFERAAARREELIVGPTDVGELLQTAAAELEGQASRKGLTLSVVAPTVPITFVTDAAKVRQVLVNLLSNAVKYTDQGEIHLSARCLGDMLEVSVRDTGIGIKPEHRERIFDPFWQADQRLTRRVGGTGLGLSIVQLLMQLLGGEITVESTSGQGSTFTIRLPAARAQRAAA